MRYTNYQHHPLHLQWQFDYANTLNVLQSVEKEEQIPAALKYLELFCKKHNTSTKGFVNWWFNDAEEVLKIKCDRFKEDKEYWKQYYKS